MSNDNVIDDLYKDIVNKRNKCKIDLDNYITELEILKRSIEYNTFIEDDSRFFSPRNNENINDNSDSLSFKMENYEKLVEETKERFNYYDGYCSRLALLIKTNNETDESDNNRNTGDKDVSYNLNLNYDVNDIKEKLLGLNNKLDLCIKIFDNDKERTKQEIVNINKALDQLINSLS